MANQEMFPRTATTRGLAYGDVNCLFGTGKRHVLGEGRGETSPRLSDADFQLVADQAVKLARKLDAMAKDEGQDLTWDVAGIERRATARLVEFEIEGSEPPAADLSGKSIRMMNLQVELMLETGHATRLAMLLRRDAQGHCLMRIQGNTTTLAIGYDAYTAATKKVGSSDERALLLCLPIQVMGRLLASVDDSGFTWPGTIANNLTCAGYRLTLIEFFTYVPIDPDKKVFFLSTLRVLLSCPVRRDDGSLALLSDMLGIEIGATVVEGHVHELRIRNRRGDGQMLQVSIADMERLAKRDATAAGVNLPEAASAFFAKHLRVSFSLNEAAQGAIVAKAASGKATKMSVTAAVLNSGLVVLNKEAGRGAVRHLLRHLFATIVPLMDLARYRPDLVDLVDKELKYNADVAAAYDEWRERGFSMTKQDGKRISFLTFLQTHSKSRVSEQVARTARDKIRDEGNINPDIPLATYNAFFAQRYLLGLDPAQMAKLVDALESGKGSPTMRTMKMSEKRIGNELLDLEEIIDTFIEKARVPAVLLVSS